MTPTIEEVKRVAEECGIEYEAEYEIADSFVPYVQPATFTAFPEELQAFAQHYINKLDGDELILAKFYGVSTKSELIIAQANHIQKLQSELPARGKQAALRKILEG